MSYTDAIFFALSSPTNWSHFSHETIRSKQKLLSYKVPKRKTVPMRTTKSPQARGCLLAGSASFASAEANSSSEESRSGLHKNQSTSRAGGVTTNVSCHFDSNVERETVHVPSPAGNDPSWSRDTPDGKFYSAPAVSTATKCSRSVPEV